MNFRIYRDTQISALNEFFNLSRHPNFTPKRIFEFIETPKFQHLMNF